MKQFKSILTAIILGGISFMIQAQNTQTMEKLNKEEQEVLQVVQAMTNAFHNKDIDGVMASYEQGAVVVFEPEKPVSDAKVLREMFQGMFSVNPKFVYSGHEVFINGDIATHFAPWTMTGTLPDGTTMQQNGLSVAILRKQKNGSWLMIFDNPHGNHLVNK